MSGKHQLHRALIDRLRAQTVDVERMMRGLDEDLASKRPAEKSWSLKEIVCHLWVIQLLFRDRAEKMLAEDNPVLDQYSPDDDADFDRLAARPASEVLADFQAEREHYLKLLDPLSPADWHRKARHPEFAGYDIHYMTEYLFYHEGHHLYAMLRQRSAFGKIPH